LLKSYCEDKSKVKVSRQPETRVSFLLLCLSNINMNVDEVIAYEKRIFWGVLWRNNKTGNSG